MYVYIFKFELVPAGERPYGARVFDAPPIYPPETPAGNNTEQLTDVTTTGQTNTDKRAEMNTEQLTDITRMEHIKHTGPAIPENKTADSPEARRQNIIYIYTAYYMYITCSNQQLSQS